MSIEARWLLAAALLLSACHERSTEHHDHAHSDPDRAAEGLRLNDGKKWQTDESLRSGMVAIRDAMQAAVKPIHEDRQSPEAYAALAANIEKQVGTIVSECKLPADADAQLHLVLAQISGGTQKLKQDGDRMAGAAIVIRGLESYAKYFDHPNWKPIEH